MPSGGRAALAPRTFCVQRPVPKETSEGDLHYPSFGTDEPSGVRIGECDSPIIHEAGQEVPSIAFIGSPCSATRSGGNYRLGVAAFPAACIHGIAEPVHGTSEWSGCGELPGFSAVARARNVVRKVVGLENFSATKDAVKRVAEIDAGYTRSGRTLRNGRVVGLPCLATVRSGKNAGLRSATSTYPRSVLALCGHAGSRSEEHTSELQSHA